MIKPVQDKIFDAIERVCKEQRLAIMFDKAGDYWKKAIRLAPNNYIEAQNWLKINGKLPNNMN